MNKDTYEDQSRLSQKQSDENAETIHQRLSKRFGRFYTGETVCKKLNISPQELVELTDKNQVLCVETSDNKKIYPEFQFDTEGKVNRDVVKILKILLPASPDGWVSLYWLTAPLADLGHHTPAEIIRTGTTQEISYVVSLAEEDAAAWSIK